MVEEGMTFIENRAKFMYEASRLAAKSVGAPIVLPTWDKRDDAFKKQFLEFMDIQFGGQEPETPEGLRRFPIERDPFFHVYVECLYYMLAEGQITEDELKDAIVFASAKLRNIMKRTLEVNYE